MTEEIFIHYGRGKTEACFKVYRAGPTWRIIELISYQIIASHFASEIDALKFIMALRNGETGVEFDEVDEDEPFCFENLGHV